MGEHISIASSGQEISAYVAGTEDATAGIVVVQEIFGVNPHIRSVVDRYAAAGYRAIAPAFFDRIETDIELEYNESGIARGVELATALELDNTMNDIQATLDHLGRLSGLVGYCWGGSMAWVAASKTSVAAAVGYYGGHISGAIALTPKVPIMLHFGERDASIPIESVATIKDAHPAIPIHTYDAEHGFNCDARASFDQASAEVARERTLEFFAEHLS